jgi:beta-lactam-binding protein with PASTA domain
MMPDFRGETVDSARALAAHDSLDIEVTGRGLAIRQDPSPGTVVVGSRRRVRVYFSYDSNGSGEG